MSDGIAEKMLGLPGLKVLEVEERDAEVVIRVESTRTKSSCSSCRRRAQAHDRVEVHVRDQHCFGRAARLVISKRRWRCRTPSCARKTWTERIDGIAARQVVEVLPVLGGVAVWVPAGEVEVVDGVRAHVVVVVAGAAFDGNYSASDDGSCVFTVTTIPGWIPRSSLR